MRTKRVAIAGAGISGLYCAKLLQDSFDVTVFEKHSRIGGRIQTDEADGFLLDHGFQVYQPAYPEGGRAFDHQSLNLKYFSPGAYIKLGKSFHYVGDPFREPGRVMDTLAAPIGSLLDKARILKLKFVDPEDSMVQGKSTLTLLKELGFSNKIIESFFRPFFSGVFLERELDTPADFFARLYQLFSVSEVAVPALGMQQLPNQLVKSRKYELLLDQDRDPKALLYDYDYVVQAFPIRSSQDRMVTTDYFSSSTLKAPSASLYLNGNDHGVINHIAPMSAASSTYAPDGQSLWAVNLLDPNCTVPVSRVLQELREWFPGHNFEHLKRYQIESALPSEAAYGKTCLQREGIYYCSDGMEEPSIQGALLAGKKVADAILHGS